MNLIKVTPDKERVRSIVKMVDLIIERIKIQNKKTMTALIIFDYYEIIKELTTALLLSEGYKTLSHKDLFDYLTKNHSYFNNYSSFLNDLRVLRNRISYEGFYVNSDYLDRNELILKNLINQLKQIINLRL
jgi:hypothetical protein